MGDQAQLWTKPVSEPSQGLHRVILKFVMENLGSILKKRSYNRAVKFNKTFGPNTSPSQLDQEIQSPDGHST